MSFLNKSNHYDFCIIGGGVIGCAIARELSKYNVRAVVLDKNGDVAESTSKANSGVLHAGFNQPPSTMKARFNVEGLSYFPKICETLDVPYKLTKKLVVAKDDSELAYLEKLYEQGNSNNCQGLSIIGEEEIKSIEPLVQGKYALFSEKTAVISPYEFTIALAENALTNGVDFRFYSEVSSIERLPDEMFKVSLTNGQTLEAMRIINSAGLYSDKIARMVDVNSEYKIYPCRGEYYILDEDGTDLLKTAVYPVPHKDGRGLGVHLTPTVNGNILIGPSADYIDSRYDVRSTSEVMETLKREAYELLPELKNITFIKNYSGLRPKLIHSKLTPKNTFKDFVIEESKVTSKLINLIGIESPGLTSAPAISKYVVEDLISKRINLTKKNNFIEERKGIIRTKYLPVSSLEKIVEKDRKYGEVICRCGRVTKGEIIQALNNPLGVKTLNAVKKRTHSMMGRCQGGFCIPKIAEIMTEELGVAPEKVVKNSVESNLFLGYED